MSRGRPGAVISEDASEALWTWTLEAGAAAVHGSLQSDCAGATRDGTGLLGRRKRVAFDAREACGVHVTRPSCVSSSTPCAVCSDRDAMEHATPGRTEREADAARTEREIMMCNSWIMPVVFLLHALHTCTQKD